MYFWDQNRTKYLFVHVLLSFKLKMLVGYPVHVTVEFEQNQVKVIKCMLLFSLHFHTFHSNNVASMYFFLSSIFCF